MSWACPTIQDTVTLCRGNYIQHHFHTIGITFPLIRSQKSVTILTEKLPSKNKKKKMVFVPAYQKPIGNQKQFVARV